MEVIVTSGPQELGRLGADAVAAALRVRERPAIGVATGSSPQPVYAELGRRVAAGELSFAAASVFMLDEYVGLPPGDPRRYRSEIDRDVVARLDVDPARVHGPDGSAADLPAECAAYERAIADAGGIDVQLLGIGSDGHIAFNEPGSSLASRTRIKTLTAQTRADNARFFDDDPEAVPRHCLTQGVGTIMEARHLVLVATGRGKAEAVHHLVEGAISALWPATILQMHPHVTVLLDDAAASRLQLGSYVREAWAAKPAWQGL